MYQFMRALVMGTGIYRKQQRKTQLGVDHVRVRQRAGANLEVCRRFTQPLGRGTEAGGR